MLSYFKATPIKLRKSISPPKLRVKPSKKSKVTFGNATQAEISYIIDPDFQQQYAHISLLGRCILFHRYFPDRRIDRWVMSRIMRRAGLTKKTIVVKKIPSRRTLRISEFENLIVGLDNKIQAIQKDKEHLVFIDEAIFSMKSY